jgi:hypothetical protein
MPPWLANAIARPSGDQLNPDFPPVELVKVTGHPPSAGISTIWPLRVIANVFPSGDSAVSPIASTDKISSNVMRRPWAKASAEASTKIEILRMFYSIKLPDCNRAAILLQ